MPGEKGRQEGVQGGLELGLEASGLPCRLPFSSSDTPQLKANMQASEVDCL